MFKAIYAIAKTIQEKDLYIYGINRDSVAVFTNLALWGADIKGFIDSGEERYVGQHYMNRPILSIEQIRDRIQEVTFVAADEHSKKQLAEAVGEETRIYFYDEVIEPNEELRQRDVYIYGIGGYGEKIYRQCCECGIKIKAACVTSKGHVTVWNGLPVLKVSEIDTKEKCAFIVATIHVSYQEQMLKELEGYEGDVYVFNYMLQNHILQGRLFQLVSNAVMEHRKIWLYGNHVDIKERLKEIFLRYSVPIEGEISSLDELSVRCNSDDLVVITENDTYEVEKICDFLDSLGFALEKKDYTSLGCEMFKYENWEKTCTDMLLGWSNMSNNAKYPGFFTYGDDNESDIRIMVLGGSNSIDGIFRTRSWVELFYEKLVRENYHITLFNGAACGHGCTRELLHLLRDGAYLGLDYVISLSGVNNITSHGVENYFSGDLGRSDTSTVCGVESTESLYEFWCRNISIMESVTSLYGAKFFAFLQPMAIHENMDLSKTAMHETRDAKEGILEFRKMAQQDARGLYTNAIAFFDGKPDVYIDNCHYSNKGNILLADLVYETMIKSEGHLRKQQS